MLVVCNHCQCTMRVPPAVAGKTGKCPKCGAVITIPDQNPSATEVPTPPPPAPSPEVTDAVAPEEEQTSPQSDQPSEAPTVGSAVPPTAEETQPPDSGAPPPPPVSFAFLAPPQADDELGRLGPYRVLKVLGQGGMGVVFQAQDVRLGRQVALKVMLPEMASKPTARERFLREARTAAAIEHDHIVSIYQVDEDRGVPFIAMPLLKGCSLEEWLRHQEHRPLPVPLILRLGRQVAQGLAAAHAHGLIHRDIKPANIFLQSAVRPPSSSDAVLTGAISLPSTLSPDLADHRVKILDFGLARSSAGEQNLTLSGVIMGTPAYMAPEQARSGSKVDARADLFSLGVVLYRLCTGTLPFRGDDMMGTLMALAMDQPTSPRELNPAVPPALSQLVMSLLEKDPNRRPGSADQVVRALEAVETSLSAAVEQPGIIPVAHVKEVPPRDAVTPAAPPSPVPPARRRHDEPEEEERPPRRRKPEYPDDEDEDDLLDLRRLKKQQTESGLAQASMIVGIVSAALGVFGLCCCSYIGMPLGSVGGIAAIGLGIAAIKQSGPSPKAQWGIALGAAALLLAVLSIGMMILGLGINLLGQRGRF
jgi:serine/threonine protein kinase